MRLKDFFIRSYTHMQTDNLKPFEELNHNNQLLRLDWFGGVQGNLTEHDNPLIEGIFTPFSVINNATGIPTFKPLINEQFMAGIAVGYLPIQFVGKFFRGGHMAPFEDWPISEKITFEIDVSDPTSVIECCLPDLQIDNKADFISPLFKSFANPAGLKKLHGTLLSTTHKNIKIIPAPQVVVIHELELVRFYLTNSSHSCKNIFTGAFSHENIEKRVVNTIHEPVTFDANTGAGRFVYRHGYKEKDASILGRILFESDALALNAAQRVSSKRVADQINSDSRLVGYPRTLFPFKGKTKLTLSGRRIKTVNGFVFLVYRIHSCCAPFPYKNLSYCDDIAPGGAAAPDNAPVAFKNQKTSDRGPAHDDTHDRAIGESTSSERPSATSVQLQIELSSRNYLGLADVLFAKEKLRDCTHRSETKIPRYLENLINASTGGGTSGKSNATRQSITERIVVPSKVTPDLETFIKVIHGLRNLHPDWDIDTLTVGTGIEINGINISEFPAIPCQKRKTVMRQFSYTDDLKSEFRRFLCVQVCVNGKYVYLFEAERRLKELPPTNNSGLSPYKEDMPVLLLRGSGHQEFQGEDFIQMIEQTVIKKQWPDEDKLYGLVKDHTVHGHGIQSTDEMCSRVAQLINRNLRQRL